jgi:hypothetical protein
MGEVVSFNRVHTPRTSETLPAPPGGYPLPEGYEEYDEHGEYDAIFLVLFIAFCVVCALLALLAGYALSL